MKDLLLEFHYELENAAIYESLTCIAWKSEGKRKQIQIGILSVLGVFCLFRYLQNTKEFFYFLLTACCVLFMFVQLYYIPHRRRRRAKKIQNKGSNYTVKISRGGVVTDEQGYSLDLHSKKVQVYESEHVITISKNSEITYCLPKDKLKPVHLKQLKQFLKEIDKRCIYISL